MNISLRWLNDYLDRPVDAGEAERVLTGAGFPLDGVEAAGEDTVLDVEVTSNRPDVLSHVGAAREVAAATGRSLVEPAGDIPESTEGPDASGLTSVGNEAADLCPMYTARVVRGVKVGPSPGWLVERLEAVGLRPVNNVVDVTNFVLHELGQPLHAFDMDRLAERRIVVRRAGDGERFTAIDGSEHALRPGMLVIADAEKPVAVAGVMGGRDSEVGDGTTDILLESARFDPLSVRSASRSLKLASDSSYRFERGVDPRGVDRASRRAARLIVELAGGVVAGGLIAVGEAPPPPESVRMRPGRCNQLLGFDLPVERMTQLLGDLGLGPIVGGDAITCTIPSHRLDLHREADLVEEVARLHGYDRIPVEEKMRLVVRPPQGRVEARRAVGRVLIAHGYHEAITFSFLPAGQAEAFADDKGIVTVDEEQKKAEPALRPSVLPGLLACRKSNQDAGNEGVRLFEVAEVFGSEGDGYIESRRLGLLADAASPGEALRAMRGTIEELLGAMGWGERVKVVQADDRSPWADPAARIVDADNPERVIGVYGVAGRAILKRFDLQTGAVLADLDYEVLISHYPPRPRVRPRPRYPAIERDLSIMVDETVAWAEVESLVRAVRPERMEDVAFVMTYRGKPIEPGRKSVTFRMTFRDPERTLRHEEVSEQVDAVVERLGKDLSAELRAT